MTTFSAGFIVLVVVALLSTYKGLSEYNWFTTAGFGYTVAAIGLFDLTMFKGSHGIGSIIICVLLIFFGSRLGYLLDEKNYKIKEEQAYTDPSEIESNMKISKSKAVTSWIAYSLFYVCVASPVFYRLHNDMGKGIPAYVGAAIMLMGLVLEIKACKQREEFAPNTILKTGLYAKMRYPVYFAEMLFWTGVFLSGASTIRAVGQCIVVLIGYLGIMYLLIRKARIAEAKHNNKYSYDESYQEYIKKTPVLVPFMKLYSLQECVWIDDVEKKINAILSKLEKFIKPIVAKIQKKNSK